jgi:solute carrier family 13 (sodium-dependent dicarboxylate transporter), member 2/3/5
MRWSRLLAGPSAALIVYLAAQTAWEQPPAIVAALGAWMAVWWISEAIPLAATALLPLVVLPIAGIGSEPGKGLAQAAAPYADPNIFTYFGGFVLALAIERWGLHERMALGCLKVIGTSPARLLLGLMIATATLSMWISNTAATTIMLPIALGLVATIQSKPVDAEAPAPRSSLATMLLLAIAFSATLGGMITPVGTPTNGVAISFLQSQGKELDFSTWVIASAPMALLLLAINYLVLWLALRKRIADEATAAAEGNSLQDEISKRWAALGRLRGGERSVLCVFALTALAWMLRAPVIDGLGLSTRWPTLARIDDTIIAMTAAIGLFVIPADRSATTFLIDWPTAKRLPWDVLLLFGGGLSLASAMQRSGLIDALRGPLTMLQGLPSWLVVAIVVASIVGLSELASNVAVATAFTPVVYALALAVGIEPIHLVIAATWGASCGFMLPVATPPNAIVFGTGLIAQRQMMPIGLWLDLISIAAITAYVVIRFG